jgi:hypothetical protein
MVSLDKVVTVIAMLCQFNSPYITKDSKEECAVSIANCVIEKDSSPTENEELMNKCVNEGKDLLKEVSGAPKWK